MLATTFAAVASSLKHARATIARHASVPAEPAPPPRSPAEQQLIRRLTTAYTSADLDGMLALLSEDVRLSMPPHPFEYRGRAVAARGLEQLFAHGDNYRLIETRANAQPALAIYRTDPHADIQHASGLLVLTLAGTRINAMTLFPPDVLRRFGLPRTMLLRAGPPLS